MVLANTGVRRSCSIEEGIPPAFETENATVTWMTSICRILPGEIKGSVNSKPCINSKLMGFLNQGSVHMVSLYTTGSHYLRFTLFPKPKPPKP